MNLAGSDSRHRSKLRRSLAGVAGTLIGLMGLVVAIPSAAGAATTPTSYHPDLDWMGSTIRAHEGGSASQPGSVTPYVTQTKGLDVSHWQGTINWTNVYNNGARFAYIKATEGTSYTDPNFSANYTNSYYAGLIRGSYHFARPGISGGATQADCFANHGGAWSKDGKTLPGTLDIEYNPYGATCYGLSHSAMVNWIASFNNEYHSRTTRWPVIYTTTDWWTTCTGNYGGFATNNPLWIARYSTSVGTLPAGWSYQTIWQYADSGTFPGDQDYFNGDITRVQALANG